MGIPIPIYVSELSHSKRHPSRAVTCPHCRQTVHAAVEVAWVVRKLWGIPVRAAKIESSFDCPSCSRDVTLIGDVAGGSIPFMHQFGFIPLLAGVIAIPILILWAMMPSGPKVSYAELAPLQAQARALREKAELKMRACQDLIAAAVKRAFPDGVLAAPPATTFIDIDLDNAPRARIESGKLEHDLCDRFPPADPTLSGYVPMEENQRRLDKLVRDVAEVKVAPAGFLVFEATCGKGRCMEAMGVISQAGAVLGLAKRTQRGRVVPWIDLKAEYQKLRAKAR
jgi:hypothetical protein